MIILSFFLALQICLKVDFSLVNWEKFDVIPVGFTSFAPPTRFSGKKYEINIDSDPYSLYLKCLLKN